MKLPALAGASTFAHLLGRGPKAAKAEDDQDDKKKSKRAEDEDDEKGDGDDEGDGPKDGKKSKAAKAEDDEKDGDEDEGDDEDKKSKKAKSKDAKAEDDDDEEGDDDSDGADMRKKGTSSARLRERARCAEIFSDAAAGKNPALAAQLAFGTDLPRSQAVSVLRAGGLAVTSRRASLDDRMAKVTTPVVGASDPAPGNPSGSQSLAAQIVAAGQKARGKI